MSPQKLAYTAFTPSEPSLPSPKRPSSPILLLHGLFGSKRNWYSIGKRFVQERNVYALDLRNHGSSPWVDTMTYPEMSEDVAHFIVTLEHSPVTIIGHSMGGKIAMYLALNFPHLVECLIVVDIAPVEYSADRSVYIQALKDLPLKSLTSRNHADNLLQQRIPDRNIRALLLQNLVKQTENTSVWKWRCNLQAIADAQNTLNTFPNTQKTFTAPVLFLKGTESDYIRQSHIPTLERLFPNAYCDSVHDAGHWIHAQQPEVFLEKSLKFCAKHT